MEICQILETRIVFLSSFLLSPVDNFVVIILCSQLDVINTRFSESTLITVSAISN